MTSDSAGSAETWTEPVLLGVQEQKKFVRSLLNGLSPSMACSVLGLSLDSARLTLAVDARFRRRCDQVPETLTENVRASLYSKALKGTAAAQAMWLKENAARKEAQETPALTPDEMLAELERLTAIFRTATGKRDA